MSNILTQVSPRVSENPEVKNWVEKTLNKYLQRNPLTTLSEVEHILDYLMSDKAPKRLQKMSYSQAQAGAAKWLKSLEKKGQNLVDQDQDIKVIKRYKSGLRLVKLLTKKAYEREGTLMSHCVASYHNKDCHIYSLRDFNNQPHCTIEVTKNEDSIEQIKGKGNGSIHPKYIRTVLAVLKHFKVQMRESEMGNLGYTKLDTEERAFIEKHFTGAKYYKKEFFYNYSNLVEI